MAETRIISVIGNKAAGKTTLIVALASEFVRKSRRVMTIKHATRAVDEDRPGSDSYIHFHEGKVERTLLVSPGLRVLTERHADDTDPVTLSRRYFDGADIVLCEGFQDAAIPEIEELNIGYSIVSRALSTGIAKAVREMKETMNAARKD